MAGWAKHWPHDCADQSSDPQTSIKPDVVVSTPVVRWKAEAGEPQKLTVSWPGAPQSLCTRCESATETEKCLMAVNSKEQGV